MIVKLSKEEKTKISKVAHFFAQMARSNAEFDHRYLAFLRITLFSKIGILSKSDYHDLLVAVESYGRFCEEYPNQFPQSDAEVLYYIVQKMKNHPAYQKYMEKKKAKKK